MVRRKPKIIIVQKIKGKGGYTCVIECNQCQLNKRIKFSYTKEGGGKFCSRNCRLVYYNINKRQSATISGKRNINWKGDAASIRAIHNWLGYNYGKSDECWNKNCLKKCDTYEWALLHDKKYQHNVNNFIKLCVKCHRLYDRGHALDYLKKNVEI